MGIRSSDWDGSLVVPIPAESVPAIPDTIGNNYGDFERWALDVIIHAIAVEQALYPEYQGKRWSEQNRVRFRIEDGIYIGQLRVVPDEFPQAVELELNAGDFT